MRATVMTLLLATLVGPALARIAAAGDGAIEINQSCAVHTGCAAGDVAGFPVTLTSAGSYRLTGDLVLPNANVDGILISASYVQLDLGGFAIIGPVVCDTSLHGISLICNPASGSGTGVDTTAVVATVVRNGGVRGMGFRGINLGDHSVVADVTARSNASTGIVVGDSSIVRESIVSENGVIGLVADPGSIVRQVVARSNRTVGIRVFEGAQVSRSSASFNGTDGILTNGGTIVDDSTVFRNGEDGIQAGPRTVITRTSIQDNIGIGVHNLSTTVPAVIRNDAIGDSNAGGDVENVLDLGGNYCGPFAPVACN